MKCDKCLIQRTPYCEALCEIDASMIARDHLEEFKENLIKSFEESECEDYREFLEEINKEIEKGEYVELNKQ